MTSPSPRANDVVLVERHGPEGIEQAIAESKKLGGTVTFPSYPGVGHDDLATAGMPETLAWLATRFPPGQ
ncbi:hypothetical protein AB0H58_26410 [Nocardia neocaledoniensis]|uniref:hypothetical protein n=1 Tax=Nocardia neocaledoniensis TaxID=236511 RepID=UPI00340CBE4D